MSANASIDSTDSLPSPRAGRRRLFSTSTLGCGHHPGEDRLVTMRVATSG